MVYKFKFGSYKGLDAQITGDELERIRRSNEGRLATESVVAAAKKKSSPLHGAFTWDVDKAAKEYQLHEARFLIRAVLQVDGGVERSAFINVSVHHEANGQDAYADRYYQSVQVIPSSPIEYESALAMAIVRQTSANNAVDELLALAPKKAKPALKRAQKHMAAALEELTV